MSVLYGASVFGENNNGSNIRYDVLGKNSEQFNVGDPVYVTAGDLAVYSGTSAIVGVAVKDQTLTSTNVTVAKVSPGYVPAENTVFLMGTNSDLTSNATDFGKAFKLTGATGAVLVDVASGVVTGNSRQVIILKVDPRQIGGTGSGSGLREVLVKFFKTPIQNVNT